MRTGTGKIYSRDKSKSVEKSTNRTSQRYLQDISNDSRHKASIHSSQSGSSQSKVEKYLELDSNKFSDKNIFDMNEDSRFMDSLVQYQNPTQRNNAIIRKLTSLNTVFKEIKQLKDEKMSYELKEKLSLIEDTLIEVERGILKDAY